MYVSWHFFDWCTLAFDGMLIEDTTHWANVVPASHNTLRTEPTLCQRLRRWHSVGSVCSPLLYESFLFWHCESRHFCVLLVASSNPPDAPPPLYSTMDACHPIPPISGSNAISRHCDRLTWLSGERWWMLWPSRPRSTRFTCDCQCGESLIIDWCTNEFYKFRQIGKLSM